MTATLQTTNIQNASSSTTNLALDTSGNVSVGSSLTAANNITATSGTVVMASSFLRNRIINGNMTIDQRNAGASQTITSGNTAYTVDRWLVYTAGSNLTSQRVGSIGSYSLQLTGASGNTAIQAIQRIESYNIADLASQSVTLSFTASSSTLTTISWYVQTPTSTDNYSATNTAVSIGSPTITSTPTRYSYTFTMPSTATNGAQVFIQTGAFTSGTLTLTNVQLEQGSVATPFERRQYGEELMLCQRYYCKSYSIGTAPGTGTNNGVVGLGTGTVTTGQMWIYVRFPVAMRTSPTITTYDESGASGYIWRNGNGKAGISGDIGDSGYRQFTNDSTSSNAFDFQYTASAEL